MVETLKQTMTSEAAFDGQPALLIELRNTCGMSITLMDIGATWLSCVLPIDNKGREVLLGTSTMANYKKMSSYMGVTAGRFANRIAAGQFQIDGKKYQVSINQSGNTLHGGPDGFSHRRWKIASQGINYVQFNLTSPDGDQGFPGNLDVFVTYQLTEDNQVIISYKASTDKATPINLTNHAYFNLQGESSGTDCKSYSLYINADHYLPTNNIGVPLGELAPVIDTGFDFRVAKKIAKDFLLDEQQQSPKGYDHSFYLNAECRNGACAAIVSTEDRSVSMKVYTNKPAIQLYTGNWLGGENDRNAGQYEDYAGVALETQFLPDSPNHPEWEQESSILRPGEQYCYQTKYAFEF
ncbi:galactose-1-epimerase [Vibrio sp. TH_r3]|uniref:galactose-1-epimerase n=1 Tax=Vibrio sp. TH_r3 TaxID=3082084 RepID=UPI002953AF3F|nr:galactose-1-epimerase [Vibrio sp. TH_r3]MDV7104725.1 galactose-1-epimerase [Vibrio sp. TH_r3]